VDIEAEIEAVKQVEAQVASGNGRRLAKHQREAEILVEPCAFDTDMRKPEP
jgi:hypothetical protein